MKAKIDELEEHRIETWREVLKDYRRPFVYLKPDDTLFEAVSALKKNRVHRLPIIDPRTGNVVCIVTHKRILRYLYLFVSFILFFFRIKIPVIKLSTQINKLNKDLRYATAGIFNAIDWRFEHWHIQQHKNHQNIGANNRGAQSLRYLSMFGSACSRRRSTPSQYLLQV